MARTRKPLDERRAELLEAARAVAFQEGLEHVTGRKVAAKAGLSSGLVFFHFATRDALLAALLDDLLEALLGDLQVPEGEGPPAERMLAFLAQRLERQRKDRRQLELFIDFWVLGLRQPPIRRRIREALERYRQQTLPVCAELAEERGGTAEALAQVAVSFILGCALQQVIDSGRVDTAEYLQSVRALVLPRKAK